MSGSSALMELDELAVTFGYRDEQATRLAIRKGKFPVKTFKIAGRWVATTRAVHNFIETMSEPVQEGKRWIQT